MVKSCARASLLFVLLAFLPSLALAQGTTNGKNAPVLEDDEEDTDIDSNASKAKSAKAPSSRAETRLSTEVVRGLYMQALPGGFSYLGSLQPNPNYAPLGRGGQFGPSISLRLGYDILTAKSVGVSLEYSYMQAISRHSGYYPNQDDNTLDPNATYLPFPAQGQTMNLVHELSARPTLRLGRSGRFNLFAIAGGGILLLQQSKSSDELPPDFPLYGGILVRFNTGLRPKPFGVVGVGLEYCTRLTHFAFTPFQIEYFYAPGVDTGLALQFAGFKYTF